MNSKKIKNDIAKQGEVLAAAFLCSKGYKILHTNWRHSNLGEIDIIAQRDNVLAFIEVKTRTSKTCGDPLESINYRKQKQIIKLAEIYISKRSFLEDVSFRLDAISVLLKPKPLIEHLEDAYNS